MFGSDRFCPNTQGAVREYAREVSHQDKPAQGVDISEGGDPGLAEACDSFLCADLKRHVLI